MRTGLDAGGCFTDRKAIDAHVALSDDAFGWTVNGDVIGTHEHAVFAANALIIQMFDDSGDCVFFVGVDGASVHARGFKTMMTGRGNVLDGGFLLSASN